MQNVGIQITAKDETAGAFKTVSGRLSSLGKDAAGAGETVGELMGKFTALGVAASAAISLIGFKAAVDTADAFSKMAQKTGVAVEQLRELNYAAALSDVSTEALGTGLRKLSINMAAAAGGGKEQAAIFAALGISVKDASGSLKGADTVLKEVAGQFANFKDGPEKAALAVQLFGKSGVDMIPLLNAGSTGLSEMAQEARDLGAVFSGDLGKQAEAFNDNLTRIGIAGQRTGYAVATELLPTLNMLAESFISAQKAGTGFGGTIGSVLRTGLETVVIFVSDVAFVIKGVGTEIGGIIAQLNALGEGGGVFSSKGRAAWSAVGQAMREDAAKARADLDKYQYDILNAGLLTSKAGAGRGTATDPRLLGDTQTSAPIVKAAAAAPAAQISDYEKLTKAIAEKTAVAKLDLATTEKLTDGQKLAEKFQSDLTLSTLKMTDAEVKSTRANIAGLIVVEQAIIAKDKAIKRLQAEYEQELQTQKEISDAQVATDNARVAGIQAVSHYADAIAEQNAYSKLELSLMGTSATAREIALGQYRVELELKKQLVAIDSNTGMDEPERIIQRARASAAASKATTEVASRVQLDDWKKSVDQYDNIFREGFAGMVNGGKGAWKSFTTSLVTTFKTSVADQIYKMFAQPFVVKFVASMLGIVGGGVSGAAQAAGTGSNLLSGASALAGGASAFGGSFAAGAALGTEAFGAGVTMMTSATGMTSFMAGAGQALGAIGPVGWAALAALAIVAIASGGETRSGASYVTGTDGKASLQMGPSGGEIASMQARSMFDVTKSSIEGVLAAFGSKATLSGFVAGLESSDNGKGFAYAGGKINGVGFGESGGRDGGQFSMGSKTAEQAIKDYQLNLSQSILEALQVTTDIPATVAKLISDGLNGSEVKALSADAVNAILANVSKLSGEVNTFNAAMTQLPFEKLKNLSFDTAAGLIAAAGGFEKLDASLSGFYKNFYTAEEQRAQNITNTSKAFADLGLTMPALDAGARNAYRSMVELAAGQDLSITANAKAYASLLALQGPMNELAPAFDAVAVSATAALKDMRAAALESASKGSADAMAALERAVGAQRKLRQVARDTAADGVREITSVFDILRSSIKELYGTVDSTAQMQAAQARAFISAAVATAQSTGYLPDSKALADAITAAKGSTTESASQFERDFAALTLAGDLTQLEALSKSQLTEAQQMLKIADDQLTALDGVLELARLQLDEANGINTSVLSVKDAVDQLAAAILSQKTTTAQMARASAASYVSTLPADKTYNATAATLTSERDRAVQAIYTSVLGRSADAGGLADYSGSSLTLSQITANIESSAEAAARALSVSYQNAFNSAVNSSLGLTSTIKAFASGGTHSGGLRIVGENGPELEATGPSRIFNASQTSAMLSGGNTDRLEALVEGLTKEVQRLQSIVDDGNKHTRRAADALNGNSEMPMLVQTV